MRSGIVNLERIRKVDESPPRQPVPHAEVTLDLMAAVCNAKVERVLQLLDDGAIIECR
jgi:hypothetical protein